MTTGFPFKPILKSIIMKTTLKDSKEYQEIQEISRLMTKNRQKIQLSNLLLLVSICTGLLIFIKLFV